MAGLLDAGVLTSIIIALLYTAGLSYAYHYFAEFHLGLLGLEIPQAYFLLYGFQVIRNRVFSVLLCIIGSIGIYFLLRFLWRRSAGHSLSGEEGDTGPENAGGGRLLLLRIAILAGSPICLLLLFIVFSRIGASTGRSVYARELRNDFPSYARVKIRLKGEQNAWSEEWAAVKSSNSC